MHASTCIRRLPRRRLRDGLRNSAIPVDADAIGPAIGPDGDVLEAALARALAAAGGFDVLAKVARELEARRLERGPNVVILKWCIIKV